jgi:hypothetical protein
MTTLDLDNVRFLRSLARDAVEASRVRPGERVGDSPLNTTGHTLIRPGGRACYPAAWVRDFAIPPQPRENRRNLGEFTAVSTSSRQSPRVRVKFHEFTAISTRSRRSPRDQGVMHPLDHRELAAKIFGQYVAHLRE